MKRGKKYNEAIKLIDKTAQYDVNDACALVKKTAVAKFDETIEAHFRMGLIYKLNCFVIFLSSFHYYPPCGNIGLFVLPLLSSVLFN